MVKILSKSGMSIGTSSMLIYNMVYYREQVFFPAWVQYSSK